MKRQNTAALIAAAFVLAACSGSEPAAEKNAEPVPAAEVPAFASEAATETAAPADAPVSEAVAAPEQSAPEAAPAAAGGDASKEEQIKLGKAVYDSNCMACHGAEGKGTGDIFPPLAGSDYFAKDSSKLIQAVTKGVNGAIKVNGKEYNGMMPAMPLSDKDIANVATYVLNSFGNGGGQVSVEDVAKIKAQ